MKIRLAEADRERLGCPEWLSLDLDSMTAREASIIQTQGGIDPAELGDGLMGQPVFDGGEPVFERDRITGEVIRNDEGIPKQKVRYNFEAWLAVIWLALRRAGVKVPYADMDFDLAVDVQGDNDGEGELGKDAGTPSNASTS